MSESIRLPEQDAPVLADVDVAVAGGGPAGVASAVAAARRGASTLLVEASSHLGGQMSGGLLQVFQPTVGTEGLFDELRDRLRELDGLRDDWLVDSELAKVALMRMAREAGVRMLFCAQSCGALTDAGRVNGMTVACKAGLAAVRSKMLIDCTGDGDIAASAGAAHDKGREDGLLQACTMCFNLAGCDWDAWMAGYEAFREHVTEYAAADRAAGRLNLPEHVTPHGPGGHTMLPGLTRINTDMVMGVDATDPWSLSDGINAARERALEIVAFLRKYAPGCGNLRLARTADLFGVRETRRFRGLATVTGDEVISGRKRADGICRASFYLDLHDGQGAAAKKRERAEDRPAEGDWYEIPYGCLVPEAVDGLLIAGRCVSSDRRANGSLRIMPTCMGMGQAAGVAAATCAAEGVESRDLPHERVQAVLRDRFGLVLNQWIDQPTEV